MKNEKQFWNSTLAYLNLDWDVRVESHVAEHMSLADLDVCVYVVDTSTSWMAAGAVSSSEMQRAAADASKDGQSELVRNDAPGTLANLGQRRPRAGTRGAREAITVALLALTQTSLFEQVRRTRNGQVAGHWLYFIYRVRNGDVLGRPMYFGNRERNLISPQECVEAAAQVVALDQNSQSNIGRLITTCGGLELAPEFNKVLS